MKQSNDSSLSVDFNSPLKSAEISNVIRVKTNREIELEKEAYQKGYKDSEDKYTQEIQALKKEVEDMKVNFFHEIKSEFDEFQKSVISEVPDILISLVKKIWSSASIESEVFKKLVDETLESWAPKDEDLHLIFSSEDFLKIKDIAKNSYSNINFSEDSNLKTGDIIIKSRFGVVDAKIETKIESLSEEIKGI